MRTLSGMDASYLHLENENLPLHVLGILKLDPSGLAGGYSFEALRRVLLDRIHLMPPFRKKLVPVPLSLANPRIIDDPGFDIDDHLFHRVLPAPGGREELSELVGSIASEPLARDKPLWEMWIVEGLDDGTVALVTKMHHAVIDGVSGADLMVHLFDLTPEVRAVDPPTEAYTGERAPHAARLAAEGVWRQLQTPAFVARQAADTARRLPTMFQGLRTSSRSELDVPMPFSAPRVPISRALTRARAVAFSRTTLDDLKTVKEAFGGKVNDAILAMVGLALRDWWLDRFELPDKALVASCPISLQLDGNKEETNRITAMFVPIDIRLDDPAAMMSSIVAVTREAKELVNALGASTLMDWSEIGAPRLLNLASRFYARSRLANLHPPISNLIVSNVPGPPLELWSAGARVEAVYPMGPLMPGSGLNVTVLSNMGNVDIGVLACPDLVPDLWQLADAFPVAVDRLLEAAAARTPGPGTAS